MVPCGCKSPMGMPAGPCAVCGALGEAWTRWAGANWQHTYGRWQVWVLESQSAVKTLHAHCVATSAFYHYQYHQTIWKSYAMLVTGALQHAMRWRHVVRLQRAAVPQGPICSMAWRGYLQ